MPWYQSPAVWTAIASVLASVVALVRAERAHTKAGDAHMIAVGHALDRLAHPLMPKSLRTRPPAAAPGSSSTPGAPGSGAPTS